jgi:hypothetical protein
VTKKMGRHPIKGGAKKVNLVKRAKQIKDTATRQRDKALKLQNVVKCKEKYRAAKSANEHLEAYKKLEAENILLIGEGDFSFTKAMLDMKAWTANSIVATTFDSEQETYHRYPTTAPEIVRRLQQVSNLQILYNFWIYNLYNKLSKITMRCYVCTRHMKCVSRFGVDARTIHRDWRIMRSDIFDRQLEILPSNIYQFDVSIQNARGLGPCAALRKPVQPSQQQSAPPPNSRSSLTLMDRHG